MRHKHTLSVLFILLGLHSYGHAQPWLGVIAPNRATDWSQAGVEGRIPSSSWTQCGSTIAAGASASTINSAINSCAANHYVLLGAGTFNISGLHLGKDKVVLRGSGADRTLLNISSDGPTSCYIGNSTAITLCTGNSDTRSSVNWTAGYAQGTTQITLSSVSGLVVGQPLMLNQADDSSDGWPANGDVYICESTSNNCSNQGGGSDNYNPEPGRSAIQWVRATAINQGGCGATCVTIDPPVALPVFRSGQSPHAVIYTASGGPFLHYAGVENLSVNYTGLQSGIRMVYCDNCWISGVRVVNTATGGSDIHNVFPLLSFHVTIRNNYFYGDQCTSGCVNNYQDMPMLDSNLLWENNIMHGLQAALIPNGPYASSVLAYNFYVGRPDSAVVLHNAGELMNLVEGNIMNGWLGDVDHGTHFFETMFRNAIVSYRFASGGGNVNTAIEPHTNNRFINVVGNVMGHSHWTTYETNLAPNDNAVYNLGWQGNISGTPVTNDTNVKRTLMRWGNWDSVTNAVRWCGNSSNTGWSTSCASTSEVPSTIPNFSNPIPSTQTLPPSFYLSSKPSWWPAAKPWPSIGPDVTGGNITNLAGHAYTNPAADCYLNVMGGPTNGSGGPLTFSADACYANSGSTPPPPPPSSPAAPTNVTATVDSNIAPSSTPFTVGESAVFNDDDTGNGNLLLAQDATLSQAGTLQSLSFYVTVAGGSLRLGIYDSTGPSGGPGAKKAETNAFTPVVGWNTVSIIAPVTLSPGTYWLAYLPQSSSLGFRANRSVGQIRYYPYPFGPMPATFSTSPSSAVTHWSLYGTVIP